MRILKDMKILNLLLILLFPFFVNAAGDNYVPERSELRIGKDIENESDCKAIAGTWIKESSECKYTAVINEENEIVGYEDKQGRPIPFNKAAEAAKKAELNCEQKVSKMKYCCSAEGVLSCLMSKANEEKVQKGEATEFKSDSDALTWISKYVGGGVGALGLAGGATIAGSSFKKTCSFLEKVSYAYTGFNAIAVSYCGYLVLEARNACTDEKQKEKYQEEWPAAKKELFAYVAKIGAGVYSAYKTNKCKKELHASKSRAVANTNNSLSKPAQCTTGLMVSYDPECSGYCLRVNNEDPVCQNLPTLPNNYRSVASPYRPSRLDDNGLQSRNRLFQAKAEKEKQRKLVQKKIERNKTYVNNTFKDLNARMNQRLKAFKNKKR